MNFSGRGIGLILALSFGSAVAERPLPHPDPRWV